MSQTDPAARLRDGFTLALGGGGARGYAHLGVIQALDELGLKPNRVVGTSIGSVLGAGLAAGLSPERMAAMAVAINPWRLARFPARLAVVDHRAMMATVVAEVGNPRIEDLPMPYAASAYDIVSGEQRAITTGPVLDALVRSCAISVVFPPVPQGDAVLADAGIWEPVPVSLARAWSDEPVLGVQLIGAKPPLFEQGPIAWSLRLGAQWLGTSPNGRLDARRYTALLAEAVTRPTIRVVPDVMIRPMLWDVNWVRFGAIETPRKRGYEAAMRALRPA